MFGPERVWGTVVICQCRCAPGGGRGCREWEEGWCRTQERDRL